MPFEFHSCLTDRQGRLDTLQYAATLRGLLGSNRAALAGSAGILVTIFLRSAAAVCIAAFLAFVAYYRPVYKFGVKDTVVIYKKPRYYRF